jgi:hypothetical protein
MLSSFFSDPSTEGGALAPVPRPESTLGIFFDQDFNAPCTIVSDDLKPDWLLKALPLIKELIPDRYDAEKITQLFLQPRRTIEQIDARRAIVQYLASHPNFDEIFESVKALKNLETIIHVTNSADTNWDGGISILGVLCTERYLEFREYAEKVMGETLGKLSHGTAALDRLLSLIQSANPTDSISILRTSLVSYHSFFKECSREKLLSGCYDERFLQDVFSDVGDLIEQTLFFCCAAQAVRRGLLTLVGFDTTQPENYTGGWNMYRPETRAHPNDAPPDLPVIAFVGPNDSGKSVSGIHLNFFLHVIAQSTGCAPVKSGNLHLYDSFLLLDRARSARKEGESALGHEVKIHKETFALRGKRHLEALDEPFSSTSTEDQTEFLRGRRQCALNKGDKLFVAVHNEQLAREFDGKPGTAIFHFASGVDERSQPFRYRLTPGVRRSEAKILAGSLGIIPELTRDAELATIDQLRWPGVTPLVRSKPDTTVHESTTHQPFFEVPYHTDTFLKAFSLDSDLKKLLEISSPCEAEQLLIDLFQGTPDLLPLERLILGGGRVPIAELKKRQAMFREIAADKDPAAVFSLIRELATFCMFGKTVAGNVINLTSFNRHINPCSTSQTKGHRAALLKRLDAYLELNQKLVGDTFTEQPLQAELKALAIALDKRAKYIGACSCQTAIDLVNTARNTPLNDAGFAVFQAVAAVAGDPQPTRPTCQEAVAYYSSLRRDRQTVVDALPSETRNDFYRFLHSAPTPIDIPKALRARASDYIERPLFELQKKASELPPTHPDRAPLAALLREARYAIDQHATISVLRLETSSYGWAAPARNLVSISNRVDAVLEQQNDGKGLWGTPFGYRFKRCNAFDLDLKPHAYLLESCLAGQQNLTKSIFGGIGIPWALMQLVTPDSPVGTLPEKLALFASPHMRRLGAVIGEAVHSIGVPAGNGLTSDASPFFKKSPVEYWKRYRTIARHFLPSEQWDAAKAAYKASDVQTLATILSTMSTRDSATIVRAHGTLFKRHYRLAFDRMERFGEVLEPLRENKVWLHLSYAEKLGKLLRDQCKSTNEMFEAARHAAQCAKLPIDDFMIIAQITDKKAQRRALQKYTDETLKPGPLPEMVREFEEKIRPILQEVTSAAKKAKLLKPGEQLIEPGEAESRLFKRFSREGQKLFDFDERHVQKLSYLLRELSTLYTIGGALQRKVFCEVQFGGDAIKLRGVHEPLWQGRKQVPQDFLFDEAAQLELMKSPNMSGKSFRAKLLMRLLGYAYQTGCAPCREAHLPELSGALFLDRVTVKDDPLHGSAGNEFKIWSKAFAELQKGGRYVVIPDELFSTMDQADQSAFTQAAAVQVAKRGHYGMFISHNGAALQRILDLGIPAVPRSLAYKKDADGTIKFTHELCNAFAPSEGVAVARTLGYPVEYL